MIRVKKIAATCACQSREETQNAIRELGDTQRELVRIQTHINDAIAAITDAHKAQIDALKTRAETL
ncbi:MAG: hypothetical protein LBF61_06945, partial [Azoarcus sp.]|nr:hypothetical protein [Azoarcus sp.]